MKRRKNRKEKLRGERAIAEDNGEACGEESAMFINVGEEWVYLMFCLVFVK